MMEVPNTGVSHTHVPVIRVEDWAEDPPLTVKYISGENELDMETVYAKIKRLTDHPGRGRLEIFLEAGTRGKYLLTSIPFVARHSHW
jgi:hypothetical protein